MNDVSLSELKSRDSSVILKSSIISEENNLRFSYELYG